MGTYFLDTSALVKRYVAEPGQDWVNGLFQRDAGNTLIISQATLAEAVAAFCAKARASDINETERDRVIVLFRSEAWRLCRLERVTTAIYTFAGDLCRMHRLRAYDAVQLACALTVRDKLATLSIVPTFVTADRELLSVASLEGLLTDDTNTHP